MTNLEVMNQALDALLDIHLEARDPEQSQAITTLRQAISDAENQEPVGYIYTAHASTGIKAGAIDNQTLANGTPLYTAPPAQTWTGLCDSEWMNIVNREHAWYGRRPEDVAHEVAKFVEAKLKEKNT